MGSGSVHVKVDFPVGGVLDLEKFSAVAAPRSAIQAVAELLLNTYTTSV